MLGQHRAKDFEVFSQVCVADTRKQFRKLNACGTGDQSLGSRLQASGSFGSQRLRTLGGTPNRDPCSLWGLIWGLPRDIGVT